MENSRGNVELQEHPNMGIKHRDTQGKPNRKIKRLHLSDTHESQDKNCWKAGSKALPQGWPKLGLSLPQ